MAKQLEIPEAITVGDLADKLDMPVTKLIGELMKGGVLATVNEQIDFETAEIITGELGLDVELSKKEDDSLHSRSKSKNQAGEPRPPVVAVMGHVDHGKTSLLDAVRGSSVIGDESGGITQHISAYQVEHNDHKITLLDTPGHEAFAAIRNHAAGLTDLVVLVVAADDGVKPQTLEAIRFANNVGVKMLVAITKTDKPEADPNRAKQALAEQNLLAEEWGGDVVMQEVSSKTKQGLPELLDMILLMSEVGELKARADGPAEGLVIESHLEKGLGPVARILVESGKLQLGDFIVAGGTYAKIRDLQTVDGNSLKSAGPSTPAFVVGFKAIPEFGDEFNVVANEKEARVQAKANTQKTQEAHSRKNLAGSELIGIINRRNKLSQLNVLVKADVQGSLTSVSDSLKALDTDEVAVRVIGASIGQVTANDLALAKSSGAIIYGFNVEIAANNRRLAVRDEVSVRLYKIIYELIDDAKAELTKLLAPEVVETELGRLKVKAVFKTTKTEVICGGEATKGKLKAPALARVMRGAEQVAEVEVKNLKRGPQDTKEVLEGEMCGMHLATSDKLLLEEGDNLEVFERTINQRTL